MTARLLTVAMVVAVIARVGVASADAPPSSFAIAAKLSRGSDGVGSTFGSGYAASRAGNWPTS